MPKSIVSIAARYVTSMLLVTSIGCLPASGRVEPSALDCAAQVGASNLADRPVGIDRTCLRLGPIVLGMSHDEVEKTLGRPHLELREPAACTNAVYVLDRSSAPARAGFSTLRVVYLDDRVAAVEAQGIGVRDTYAFDRLRVGDNADDVRRAFGPPHEVLGQVWSYQPVLFLLDDGSQTIEAIAVSETEGAFACLLPATIQLSCDPEASVTVIRPPSDEIRLHGRGNWPGTIIRRSRACKR
jgi:hypothetical protein